MRVQTRRWIRGRSLTGCLLIACVWVVPRLGMAQEAEIIAGGKQKYDRYCAYCHGPGGKGDGEMKKLLVIRPRDLTQLSKQNNGIFPFWQVYRMIDGREEVRGHGSRAMPIWGFIFQVQEGGGDSRSQEDLVRGRIWQLVSYLETLQEK